MEGIQVGTKQKTTDWFSDASGMKRSSCSSIHHIYSSLWNCRDITTTSQWQVFGLPVARCPQELVLSKTNPIYIALPFQNGATEKNFEEEIQIFGTERQIRFHGFYGMVEGLVGFFGLVHPGRLTWNMSSWRFGSDHFSFLFMGDGCRFQPFILQGVLECRIPAKQNNLKWSSVKFLRFYSFIKYHVHFEVACNFWCSFQTKMYVYHTRERVQNNSGVQANSMGWDYQRLTIYPLIWTGMEYPHAVNIDFLVSTLKLKTILKQVGELVPSCWSFTIQCTLSA